MVALLGPPPPQLLADSGSRALEFLNDDGSTHAALPTSLLSQVLRLRLERTERPMKPEDAPDLLSFMRRTLTWTHTTRASAADLLRHPWVANVEQHVHSDMQFMQGRFEPHRLLWSKVTHMIFAFRSGLLWALKEESWWRPFWVRTEGHRQPTLFVMRRLASK